MKVAIHQPNFLPWMGYFYKIAQCDTFVFFNDAEYTKRSYIRRVKIHKPNVPTKDKYIIVPLQKHSDYASISELKLMENAKWQRKIKAQIHQSYGKARYYYQMESILDTYFCSPWRNISFIDFTTDIIMHISDMLDISPVWIHSETLDIQKYRAEANIEMVQKVGGTEYLSGLGAKKYQTISQYQNAGITLIYNDFPSRFNSLQLPDHFLNKSVLSYLAWYGLDEVREMLKMNQPS